MSYELQISLFFGFCLFCASYGLIMIITGVKNILKDSKETSYYE